MTDSVQKLRDSPDDQAAWAEFFRRLYPRVLFLLFRLSRGNRTTAEEISQEVFARFVRYGGLSKVKDEESAAAFLRMMARNAYLSSIRSGKPIAESLAELGDDRQPRADDAVAALERAIDFERKFKKLDASDRQLLGLCMEGYSLKEVAERMGTSYTAAAVRVHRLRRRLKEDRRAR